MSLRVFGCKRFNRLLNEGEDRDLNVREKLFVSRHSAACPECRGLEVSLRRSLNMLRAAALDAAAVPDHFDERVIRIVRLNKVKESLGYWSPAFVGGILACVALLATLHVLTIQAPNQKLSEPAGQAMRGAQAFPSLELHRLPSFDR